MHLRISAIGFWVAAALSITTMSGATTPPTIKVSPATAQVHAGTTATQTFTAVESGVTTAATTFTWTLSGPTGSTGSLGTIDTKGVYTSPAVPPVPNTVTVTATAGSLSGTATVTVLDPVPVISKLSTYNINTGLAYTLDIIGTGFLPSYQVMLNGTKTASTFMSATDIQIAGTSTAAAGTKLTLTVVDPSTGGKTSNAATITVEAPVAVTVSPDGRAIRCGTTLAIGSRVANNSDQAVTWQVNGIAGGNSTVGKVVSSISPSGTATVTYTAPTDLPAPPATPPSAPAGTTTPPSDVSVTITATSVADTTASASLTVYLLNPTPVITSVNPTPVTPGAATFTINGSGFAQGAVVYFAGTALTITNLTDTSITATGTVTMPVGRLAAVKVTNPSPGGLTSVPFVVPVRLAKEVISYAQAVKFLEMATFGPTPASVLDLQTTVNAAGDLTTGLNSWLTTQFAKPASVWPDPLNDSEGMGALQTAFFNIALNGDDQLRQRVSFALAQIMVASGVKDTEYSQMVSYQRLLGNDAFTTYRTLLGDMTLNPAMGYYLDMVNNDKANPTKNTVANENYARESMQLFTVGLVQLNQDGTAIPNAAPEYSQQTVTDIAKVFTGWTYSPAPGYASAWTNPPYYFLPMVPFENHHDTTAKNISLPTPCQIAAGGTAESDLSAALDCLAKQSNMAPFVSYRLIQRLVESNPSPAYVSAVAGVFSSSGGDLKKVITTILTNPEALAEGSGKLAEPVLYTTDLLRGLNAAVSDSGGINGQPTLMGQDAMEPGSVFSYFSPFYRVSGVPAPEFQAVNAATSIARANYAWKAVTNGIASTIKVDLTNLEDLFTADPNMLVEAINQALFRGEMNTNEKAIILAATTGSTNAAASVRSALYAAAAAPQYQVQQ